MVVADDLADVEAMLAAARPQVVREWAMADFEDLGEISDEEVAIMRGMQAFRTARCNQCHVMQGHGVNLGPDLTETIKRVQGEKLLRQILEPSHEINEKYRTWQFLTVDGEIVTGFVKEENEESVQVIPNLLTPDVVRTIAVEEMLARTSWDGGAWHVVPGEQKRYARVTVLETAIAIIEDGMRQHGMEPLEPLDDEEDDD